MQRINYLKILITMVIAGLIVFAAFMVSSDRKEKAKLQRIMQHVEESLRCYRSFEENDSVSGSTEQTSESNDNSTQDHKDPGGCTLQQTIDTNNEYSDIISELLEKIHLLKDPPEKEPDSNTKDAVEDTGFLRTDVELQLARLKASLPFSSLWLPEFSTTVYDSLTTSGNIYAIPNSALIENLTDLKLAQEYLDLLEHAFRRTVTDEISPVYSKFADCQSRQSEPLQDDDPGCSAMLLERNFMSTLERLDTQLQSAIGVKGKMETIRREAIVSLNTDSDD